VLRRPAWQASLAGLAAALIIAIGGWQMPVHLAASSTAAGVAFALWPSLWIVFAALILYNTAVLSGRFDAFRRWVLDHLPNDKRIVLIVIGYGFGSLLEGVSGFGAPVAITASLLIMLGFKPIDAVVYALIINTAPVAFGSLGIPITTLAGGTDLPAQTLGAMVGPQLPILAQLLPFYFKAKFGGMRSVNSFGHCSSSMIARPLRFTATRTTSRTPSRRNFRRSPTNGATFERCPTTMLPSAYDPMRSMCWSIFPVIRKAAGRCSSRANLRRCRRHISVTPTRPACPRSTIASPTPIPIRRG
jgi:hypothetical protein